MLGFEDKPKQYAWGRNCLSWTHERFNASPSLHPSLASSSPFKEFGHGHSFGNHAQLGSSNPLRVVELVLGLFLEFDSLPNSDDVPTGLLGVRLDIPMLPLCCTASRVGNSEGHRLQGFIGCQVGGNRHFSPPPYAKEANALRGLQTCVLRTFWFKGTDRWVSPTFEDQPSPVAPLLVSPLQLMKMGVYITSVFMKGL